MNSFDNKSKDYKRGLEDINNGGFHG